jgi:hypothetical protein
VRPHDEGRLFSRVAAKRHGFVVYLMSGATAPRTRAEARTRTIIRLCVVRGLDQGGRRKFLLFGPPGVPVPVPHTLTFLPEPPRFADVRLKTCRDRAGVLVWTPAEPLRWTLS